MIERGPGWELRLGEWQDVLADVESVDAVICDPPYLGANPNASHSGLEKRAPGDAPAACRQRPVDESGPVMPYDPATAASLTALVDFAADRSRSWTAIFNDWPGVVHVRAEYERHALTVAPAPVVWIKPPQLVLQSGSTATVRKDCEFVAVARRAASGAYDEQRRGFIDSRSLPGIPQQLIVVTGGKPIDVMRSLVRDYSDPGDLICDPCAGGATTLLAAVMEGRRAIGAERDPVTFAKAVRRLRAGWTVDIFAGGAA